MKLSAVLLAAGESSRFWPLSEGRHKSTISLCGKPIILWTIEGLVRAGIKDIVVVQSARRDVEAVLSSHSVDASLKFVVQKKPEGMGAAVMLVEDMVDDHFFVLNPNHVDADRLLYSMVRKLKSTDADAVLSGVETREPWNYGVLALDESNKPVGVVEKPEKGKQPSNLRVLGIYLLSRKFFEYHRDVKPHHYSFEDALTKMLGKENAELVISEEEMLSLKYPWHLFDLVKRILDKRFNETVLHENADVSDRAVVEGKVIVEEGARIFENAVIRGPCYIGRDVIVGNNSVVRDYTTLEPQVIVGANAEVTRSIFLEGAHVHAGFFGDTVLGENSRIGAGTVFANVLLSRKNVVVNVKGSDVDTGRRKLGGIVGSNTRIGVNCSIMPGKLIGNDVVVGPSTVVDQNIPSNKKYLVEFQRVIKDGG